MFKRQLAVLLSAAMILTTAVPVTAFADTDQETTGSVLEEEASDENMQTDEIEEDEEYSTEESTSEGGVQEDTDSNSPAAEEDGSGTVEDVKEEETKEEPVSVNPEVKAELSTDEKKITVTALGVDPEATAVTFPIWSNANGQDDIEWASAEKQEDGSWKAVVSVKAHKNTGVYSIHCYQTVAGKMSFLNYTKVTVAEPKGTVKVENLDAKKGTFTVRLTDLVVPSGVTKVQIPIWGASGGQNDIVWYQAEKDGEDYVIKADAAKHQYENGLYYIHCYVTDGNGFTSYVGNTNATIEMESGLNAVLSEDESTITVTAKGINPNATAVVFPVWSKKNGQDDLKWIDAKKSGTGVWTAQAAVKGHKDSGIYLVHCYQTVNGKQTFFGDASVTVTTPSGTVSATTPDEKSGAFEASVSDLQVPAGVKQVQFAVWGGLDGQNDIVWHTATKKGNKYVANITPGEHKFETGIYYIHCYITDKNDLFSFAGKTDVNVSLKEGVSATVAADQKTVQIQYTGPKAGSSLKVAVWSQKGGQDDIAWYTMKQNGNGATATVMISNHKTAGNYFAHVYTGDNKYTGETSFVIDGLSSANVTVSEMDGKKGTFKVTVSGLTAAAGIEKVTIPVWPNGDQSKINWYTATKSGDDYVCTVNVEKHGMSFGRFDIHVYAYANNGLSGLVGNTTTSLEADCYIYAEKTGTYTTRVWLLNAGSDVTGVSFKAWSNKNGTDDVVTYTGVKSGTNNYYADIQSKKHKNGGTYTTEAYVKTANGSNLAGTVSYSMAKEGEAQNQQMFEYAQGFSSDTEYLILVNRGLHRVAIYQGSRNNWKEIKYWPCVVGKPSTPTPTGTFKIKGRFNYFGDGHLCWWCTQIEGYYYFHTVLYYTDTAPIKVLDGTMDAAVSAGCIRLEEPNARFIYTTIPRGTTVHIYN